MDVPFQEQVINYLSEVISDPIYQEEVGELQLSESLPKIDRLIDCSGYLCNQRKQIAADTVMVEGEIKVRVLYQAEDEEGPRAAEKMLSFTVKKELPSAETVQTVFYQGWVKQLDAKLLGDRKLLIRANIGSRFSVYSTAELSVHHPTERPKILQLLKNTYELMLPADCAEKEFRMNEEVALPETAADLSELLKSSAVFYVGETKTVGDKVVLKGLVKLHVLYASQTGTLHCFDTELPFSQFAELHTEVEDGEARINVQLLSCEIEADNQSGAGRLLVNLTAAAQATVYRKQRVELYEDAFVTKGVLNAQWQEVGIRARLDSQSATAGAELTVPVTTERVVEATVYPDQPILRRTQNAVKLVMPIQAAVLYLDKDGELQSKKTKGELTYETSLEESALCAATGAVYDLPVCLASYDTVTVRTVGQLQIDSFMGGSLKTISSAAVEAGENRKEEKPSLIARRAGKESVWEIAKNYRSTVELICEANGLTTGVVQEGTILLIPMQ